MCDIYVNENRYVKKRNYFVFIKHQVNIHGVSRRWITETDVKHFKSGTLRAITNVAEKEYTFYGQLKKINSQVYFKDFIRRHRTAF